LTEEDSAKVRVTLGEVNGTLLNIKNKKSCRYFAWRSQSPRLRLLQIQSRLDSHCHLLENPAKSAQGELHDHFS